MTAPRATYRLQLHAGFDFDAAVEVVPYLARLGISHVYTSPILQAVAGSTHGYDVVDHSRISADLGGEAGFERLVAALRRADLGLVVDVVPNHMAISAANAWWWDVLRHGPASAYAQFFDVDWDPPEARLHNVILLPVLGNHYGRVLEAGDLQLEHRGGMIEVAHAEQRFPLDPRTLEPILADAGARSGSDELAFVARALGTLPPSTSTQEGEVERRRQDAAVLGERLAELASDATIAAAVDGAVAAVNADADALDRLLDEQNYRLAYWRAASRDLGYRRFFDIDTLVALRVERREVFEATHRLILDRVAAGEIQGLRIDHPDGLRDPAGYFGRLREAAPDAWIVAEKILEGDEMLPDWPIDGTTGYRFAILATNLLVDVAAERALTTAYEEFTGDRAGWTEAANASRHQVLAEQLGSDVNRLTELWLSICEANRRYRDFTRHELHEALREVAAAMPVYRTYVRAADDRVSAGDREVIAAAAEAARARRPDLDPELFEFLGRILALRVPGPLPAELAMRFQQLTPAAMAKGIEDTAFYRYLRLLALNEVGGDPGRFGVAPDEFHAAMARQQASWPDAMLTTFTHDTKRSGDVRARLATLAEVPGEWASLVDRLHELAAPHAAAPDLPGAKAEYLFFQTLVGAWPLDVERAAAYMEKATREAKERTSWTDPDPAFDDALASLVRGCLADPPFADAVAGFVAGIDDAARANALGQTLWKLTAPGVPDLYQGSELWDLSLVDPDNRRPVDFELRRSLLARAAGLTGAEVAADAEAGLAKLFVVRQALALRARHGASFGAAGAYRPLAATGAAGPHLVGFFRGDDVISIATRLPLTLAARGGWGDTALALPEGGWRDALTGVEQAGQVRVSELLATFPVALLERGR